MKNESIDNIKSNTPTVPFNAVEKRFLGLIEKKVQQNLPLTELEKEVTSGQRN